MSNKMPNWFTGLSKAVAFHNSGDELKNLCSELDIEYEVFGNAPQKGQS